MEIGENLNVFLFITSAICVVLLLLAIHTIRGGEGKGVGKLVAFLLSFFSGILVEGFLLFAESDSKLTKLRWREQVKELFTSGQLKEEWFLKAGLSGKTLVVFFVLFLLGLIGCLLWEIVVSFKKERQTIAALKTEEEENVE